MFFFLLSPQFGIFHPPLVSVLKRGRSGYTWAFGVCLNDGHPMEKPASAPTIPRGALLCHHGPIPTMHGQTTLNVNMHPLFPWLWVRSQPRLAMVGWGADEGFGAKKNGHGSLESGLKYFN